MTDAPILSTEAGWKVNGLPVWIDPQQPVSTAVISHAHGDHAIPGHHTVHCTPATARLMTARFRKFADEIYVHPFHERFTINDTTFFFAPAGHMLGAAQICWERNNKRIVYSGDFQTGENPVTDSFEIVQCDTFITECTFGQPGKSHPEFEDILIEQLADVDMNYVIGVYAMGKAQRINSVISSKIPHLTVMVHQKILPYHNVYRELGKDPGQWVPYHKQVFRRNKNMVYLVPPQVLFNMPPGLAYRRGFASGWIERQKGLELLLPLSDHADWPGLIDTIIKTGAKEVYTLHGDGNALAGYFEPGNVKINILNQ